MQPTQGGKSLPVVRPTAFMCFSGLRAASYANRALCWCAESNGLIKGTTDFKQVRLRYVAIAELIILSLADPRV